MFTYVFQRAYRDNTHASSINHARRSSTPVRFAVRTPVESLRMCFVSLDLMNGLHLCVQVLFEFM
jgi:hypothetical protein